MCLNDDPVEVKTAKIPNTEQVKALKFSWVVANSHLKLNYEVKKIVRLWDSELQIVGCLAFNRRRSLISSWNIKLKLHGLEIFQLLKKMCNTIFSNLIFVKYFSLFAISKNFFSKSNICIYFA